MSEFWCEDCEQWKSWDDIQGERIVKGEVVGRFCKDCIEKRGINAKIQPEKFKESTNSE